ncbi:scn4aa [Symbiodinium sp. CCMP2592]|nr:scn4aa [Symbiodinium sp. CCMP2592]
MGHREVDGRRVAFVTWGSVEAPVAVIFLHGFGGDRHQFAHQAQAAADAGAESLAVDLTSLTEGGSFREIWVEKSVRSAQRRNVLQVVDHASWFARGRPFVLVGHSAGGGIALESAVELQQSGKAPLAVLLLDGVGWPATDEVASKFNAVDTRLLSIRAEPSAWNKNGCVAETVRCILAAGVPHGHLLDVKVHGAKHGDPIALKGWMYGLLGLIGSSEARDVLDRLVKAFLCQLVRLHDAAARDSGEAASRAFLAELQELQESGSCSVIDLAPAEPG